MPDCIGTEKRDLASPSRPVSRLPSPVSRLPSPVSRLPSPVSRLRCRSCLRRNLCVCLSVSRLFCLRARLLPSCLVTNRSSSCFRCFRAVTDPRDGKRVALKKMPNVFQTLVSAKRVFRELKMLCFFKHDNVSWSAGGLGRREAGLAECRLASVDWLAGGGWVGGGRGSIS